MKTLHFKAYDNVNEKWYFSKDYNSLKDFFDLFDNVQHSIHLISRGEDILKLIEESEKNNSYSNSGSNDYKNESTDTQKDTQSQLDPFDLLNSLTGMFMNKQQGESKNGEGAPFNFNANDIKSLMESFNNAKSPEALKAVEEQIKKFLNN